VRAAVLELRCGLRRGLLSRCCGATWRCRGNFWVGTVAPTPFDTVTHSTMRSETLEFQRRCPSEGVAAGGPVAWQALMVFSPRTATALRSLAYISASPVRRARTVSFADARSSILLKAKPLICETDNAIRMRATIKAGGAWSSQWRTSYQADFLDRPQTAY
jgi:hypothetical protein